MGMFQQDLRYGLRMHRKTMGISIVATLTLALGIGCSTAVFSVVNAVLLNPLPYSNSEKIVIPWRKAPAGLNLGYNEIPWNMRSFRLFVNESKSFQNLGAFKRDSFNLTGSGDPTLLEGLRASAGFFPSLGVSAILGRTFTPDEDKPGHDHEVILSFQLWQERFGGDHGILGRVLDLSGDSYTVIGVMPSGFVFPRSEEMPGSFNFPREAQLWAPLTIPDAPPTNALSDLAVIGRLKDSVTIAQSQGEMNVLAKRQEEDFPRFKGWFNARVTSLAQQVEGDTRTPLLLLLGAVGVVLLIACSNVANLVLAKSLGRSQEFTLRAALGARQGRLIRQLLTENLVLAALGGIVGLAVAEIGIHFVKAFGPSNIPRLREVSLDLRVLAFAIGVTLMTGILFGLAPAIGAGRKNLIESLKEGGQRSGGGAIVPRIRKAVLVAEVALALVLVVAAGLLSQTFFHMLNVNGGFNAKRVLTFELSLPAMKYADTSRIVALYQQMLQQFKSVAGVESVGIVETVPMDGGTEGTVVRIPNHPSADEKERPSANYTIASPGYFAAAGTPLLRGRDFLDSDTIDSMQVTVINDSMAKKFWPGEDPLGQQVGLGNPRFPLMTIIGIVADVKHLSLREDPGPEMYVPYTQKPYPSMLTMHVMLRTRIGFSSMLASVREVLHGIDQNLPLAKVTTLEAIVDNSMAKPRFSMLVLGAFAALALLLACVGMYGVISYSVMQRTREIGVRMALGAQRKSVFGMVLGQGVRLAGLGTVIGVVVALGVTRMMASFLYGVHATDPLTFAVVSVLLVGVAMLASYLPARRATRLDPIIALRCE